MSTHRIRSTVLLVAIALLVVACPVAHAQSTFQAHFSGHLGLTGPTRLTLTGTGDATYMGPITSAGHVDITGLDTGCLGGLANTNTETFTALNGDTLTVRQRDVACPSGPGRFHGTGNWSVVGGTGLFRGAAGGGFADGGGDLIAHTFAITLTGAIALAEQPSG